MASSQVKGQATAVGESLEESLGIAQSDMVDSCGRFAQSIGLARSLGEIYGLLYMSAKPLGIEDIAGRLSLSKASVSTGTRQLMAMGCLRKVWVRTDRRDYFEAITDLRELAWRLYQDVFKDRVENAEIHLSRMVENLKEERRDLDPEEYAVMKDRVGKLLKLQKRIRLVLPLAEKILK